MLNIYSDFKSKKRKILLIAFSILFTAIIICSINFCISGQTKQDAYIEENPSAESVSQEVLLQEEKMDENKTKDEEKNETNYNFKEKQDASKNKEEDNKYNVSKKKNSTQSSEIKKTEEDYTKLYPDLYCNRPTEQIIPSKTIFLTFDDGPSARTTEILDILRQKDVKATFFVTGNATPKGKSLMKQIVDEGHTIAAHTYSHNYKQIYASVSAFLEDFNNIYHLIYEATGVKPTIFRFPGGSRNGFNKNNYREIAAEMRRRGFDYFDWNLSAGDAVSRTCTPTQNCINNVLGPSKSCDHGVVLMHDANAKVTTVEALTSIIDGLKSQGFNLAKLTNEIDPSPYSLIKPYR